MQLSTFYTQTLRLYEIETRTSTFLCPKNVFSRFENHFMFIAVKCAKNIVFAA